MAPCPKTGDAQWADEQEKSNYVLEMEKKRGRWV